MTVKRSNINDYVSDALERAHKASERKSKTSGGNSAISMEDFFKMMQAQAKYMGIDNEGNDFDTQAQIIQMQQHQLALESYEMQKRQDAYEYVGKEVLVKKRNPATSKLEGVSGIVEFVEFPKDAKEPKLFINGDFYSIKDIIGEGEVKSVAESTIDSQKVFEEKTGETKTLKETAEIALQEINEELEAIKEATTKQEYSIVFSFISLKQKEIDECFAKAEKEEKQLQEEFKANMQRLQNFKEQTVDDSDDKKTEKKVDMSKGQLEDVNEKSKDLKAQHMTKEKLIEQTAATQRALATSRKIKLEISEIKSKAEAVRKEIGKSSNKIKK